MYASVRNSRVPRTHLEQQQQQQQRQQQQLSKNKKNNSSTKSSMKRMLFAYSAVGVVLCCVGECTSGHFYHYSHPYNPSTEEATVGESKAIWVAVSTPSNTTTLEISLAVPQKTGHSTTGESHNTSSCGFLTVSSTFKLIDRVMSADTDSHRVLLRQTHMVRQNPWGDT
jgi:hypothetical protein